MFGARTPPTAELGGGRRRWSLRVVVLPAALVTATSSSVVSFAHPAGGDQVATLQAQATAIAQQLVREQLQVDADQQQYSVVSANVAADDQAIAALDQQIGTTEQGIATRSSEIRAQAVHSYVDEGAQTPGTALFTTSADRVQVANEYQSIAVGNITTQIAELRVAERTLQAQRSQLAAKEAADRSGRALEATALSEANSTAQQLSSLHSQVTGQLASAVATAQASQRSAAAAAVAAAQRSSVPRQGAGGGAVPGPPAAGSAAPVAVAAPAGSGADPALPPFLQCVVQAESGGDYGAVSPGGTYMGAFQFSQSTWNMAAQAAGRPDLVGVPPNHASKADQDTLAVTLYNLDGEQPWLGDRCSGG